MSLYSIVVPVFNSERSLRELTERIAAVFDGVVGEPFEIIFVDDGSHDRSYDVICEIHEEDSRVKGVQLATNFGQQKAVMCGFKYVSGDYVITLDDDLQHPPEEIPVLIDALRGSPDIDVVVGCYDEKKHGFVRRLGSALMDWSSNTIYGKRKSLKLTSFRLMRRFVVDNLLEFSVSTPTIGPLLLQTNQRIANVVVHHDERAYGASGYTFGQLVSAFMGNFINNSDLLIKAIMVVGLCGMAIGVLMALYVILRALIFGASVRGWASTMVAIFFMGSIILLAMSILGKYVSNLMREAKKTPMYLIRDEKL